LKPPMAITGSSVARISGVAALEPWTATRYLAVPILASK
jgi:hypothetical protein